MLHRKLFALIPLLGLAILLVACGSAETQAGNSTAPTATTQVKAEPTATKAPKVEPTATAAPKVEPTATEVPKVEPTATEVALEAPTAAPKEEPTKDTASTTSKAVALGTSQELDNYKVTVNSMRRESTGNFDPKPGNEYVIVNITVETDSQEKEPVSSLMQFELADTSGQKFDESLFAKVNGQLDGDVTAGAPFTGEIAYEVPQGAKGLQLLFSGLLSENKLAFDLGE